MKEEKGLSRRDVIKGSLITAAGIGVMAVAGHTEKAEAAPADKKEHQYDTVIIGAGCGGLSCAIRAAQAGLKPVLIEKMKAPAGNTVFSAGIMLGVNTKMQQGKKLPEDSVEKFYEDMMTVSQGKGDKALTKYVAEHADETLEWLVDYVGVKYMTGAVLTWPMSGRAHITDGDVKPGGKQLSEYLVNKAKSLNIPILYNMKGIELITDDTLSVVGVKALGPEGIETFKAKYGVVMSVGGFSANQEMVTSMIGPWGTNMPIRGSRIIAGENFILSRPLFPKFVNVDQFHCGPIYGPTGANPLDLVNYGICVNKQTERYVDESNTYVRIAKETVQKTKDNWAFIIMDSDIKNIPAMANNFESYKRTKAPVYEGNTIEEVAEKAGLDKAKLAALVKEYNAALKNKTLDKMTPPNTLPNPRPILKPPFMAMPFQGGMTATFGGPLINTKAQVLNTENKVVNGLYAVGNSVGGLFYDDYVGGAQLTSAAVFGIAAANHMASKKA